MEQFIYNYGPWLLVGLIMLLMMRRGGCCGGHAGNKKEADLQEKGGDSGQR